MKGFRSHSYIYRILRAGCMLAGLSLCVSVNAFEYDVVDLGTLGGSNSAAFGLNDRGQAVGWALDADTNTQAFMWQNGIMTGLGFYPGESNSVARAINNVGQITGFGNVSNRAQAFIYYTNTLTFIGTAGGTKSWGHAINESGDIAGSTRTTNFTTGTQQPHGFLYRSNQFVEIQAYNALGNVYCEGFGINEDGRVCGATFLWAASERLWGYVWRDNNTNYVDDFFTEMQVLGALGSTSHLQFTTSGAFAINDAGQVVGYTSVTTSSATNSEIVLHAFLVTPSGGSWKSNPDDLPPVNTYMQDLGTLDGHTNYSYANAINNKSWIVGTSTMRSGTNRAFLWRNGAMLDLNDLIPINSGWILTNATAINEHNEIVGSGLHDGKSRAFMLTHDGRITSFDTVTRTEFVGIYTNESDQVLTQTVDILEEQVIQWAGLWGTNTVTSHYFTVESSDSLLTPNWAPYEPTSQWPITENIWSITNFDVPPTSRFFRIRAE